MEHYKGNLAVTGFQGVSITRISPDAFDLIDRLARERNIGRSAVARCVLEHHVTTAPDTVAELVAVKLGKPKKRRSTAKCYGRRSTKFKTPAIPIERAQDRVCREIHGCVPTGGCRYPQCACTGQG